MNNAKRMLTVSNQEVISKYFFSKTFILNKKKKPDLGS